MTIHRLAVGALFRFADRPNIYEYRGNGWYSTPQRYDGGPWHCHGDPVVILM
jgi:hypothetical protein